MIKIPAWPLWTLVAAIVLKMSYDVYWCLVVGKWDAMVGFLVFIPILFVQFVDRRWAKWTSLTLSVVASVAGIVYLVASDSSKVKLPVFDEIWILVSLWLWILSPVPLLIWGRTMLKRNG